MTNKNIISKIPLVNVPDTPLFASTQDFIPIADIDDGIVIFKDGGASMVLESTSLNFGLLSENEQIAVVGAFAAFINSLSFPIQLMIKTQKKDISNYLIYLEKTTAQITNPKLKEQATAYKKFIAETIKTRKVLGKRFFVVIPFSPIELGLSKNLKSTIPFVGKKITKIPYTKEYVSKKALTVLSPKRDHLVRQAARLGLKLNQLDTNELIQLYYNSFNQKADTIQKEELQTEI